MTILDDFSEVKSPRHIAALELAAQGVPVFPCVPGGKAPAVKDGFKGASADPAQMDAWWSREDFNIGVRPADMGLVCLDLDHYKPGGVREEFQATLPATRTHQTPHGGD
jgi:hypothetical protein